jgi:mannose-6-phosphate isomerase-like protein (cupin superfamily)
MILTSGAARTTFAQQRVQRKRSSAVTIQTDRIRFDASQGPRLLGPTDGERVDLDTLGVRFMVWGAESGGGFSLVEHPIAPRGLCAPLHRHTHEDEYSYVVEGRMGAQLGDDVVYAEVGDLVFKPRGQWHTFWNAGDGPCRILEIISPAGFEQFFAEIGSGAAPPDVGARYGLEFDLASVPRLCEEHGLTFAMPGD